jgi:hypothetical protein
MRAVPVPMPKKNTLKIMEDALGIFNADEAGADFALWMEKLDSLASHHKLLAENIRNLFYKIKGKEADIIVEDVLWETEGLDIWRMCARLLDHMQSPVAQVRRQQE